MRSKVLMRPLKPMSLKLSVWTTSGGWPGLINWAGGPPDWDVSTYRPPPPRHTQAALAWTYLTEDGGGVVAAHDGQVGHGHLPGHQPAPLRSTTPTTNSQQAAKRRLPG